MPENSLKSYITLLDVSKEIQSVLLQQINTFYWIRAEVAKLNFYRQSGHCYPQLVEKKDGQVLADMRSTIWANDYRAIQHKFRSVAGKELSDGMTILFYARVNYHPLYGLSLQITDVDPTFTLGEMALERTRTINRIKSEGLWDMNRSLKMPLLPQRLAIISVETSKGYHDFRNITDNNTWGYSFFHMLFPALLQGDKAVESIGRQLDLISSIRHHFDVVLIIRGGGGDVGMNCFDNYHLASRVAKFPIPVISGIGHSTNETIVEMVSHTNSITPTDVAYSLLQYFHNYSVKLENFTEKLTGWPVDYLAQEKRRLEEAVVRITGSARLFTGRSIAQLQRLATMVTISPVQSLKSSYSQLDILAEKMHQYLRNCFRHQNEKVKMYEKHITLMDPVNVLQRGYAIARAAGKAIRSAEDVKTGDDVEITLYKGEIETIVKKTIPGK